VARTWTSKFQVLLDTISHGIIKKLIKRGNNKEGLVMFEQNFWAHSHVTMNRQMGRKRGSSCLPKSMCYLLWCNLPKS